MLVFTHRVSALHELTDWDWVGAWTKRWSSGSRLGNSCVLPHWEPIFMYGIHGMGTASTYTSDVFEFNPVPAPTNGKRGRESWAIVEVEDHPTPKPIGLYHSLTTAFGQFSDTVLDPFMGSGTTLRAAKDLGKNAIGIEVEERYCEIAARRLSQGVLDFAAAAAEPADTTPA
jgi:hypothetical protein